MHNNHTRIRLTDPVETDRRCNPAAGAHAFDLEHGTPARCVCGAEAFDPTREKEKE